jgi:hypothetical protein
MAAAPQSGTMIFMDGKGMEHPVDVYVSDVLKASLRFDAGGGAGAGSESFYTFNFPVWLVDYSIPTGITDTTFYRVAANNKPSGNVVRHAIHLNTLNNRPKLSIGFKANARISGIQG